MGTIDARFAYPKHDDFFVVEKKDSILKPQFKKDVKKQPEARHFWNGRTFVDAYIEKGTLLLLPDGPRYQYKRNEVYEFCGGGVKKGQIASALLSSHSRYVTDIWPIRNETFFTSIPKIDGLVSRLEKAVEMRTVDKDELERVKPIINNQRIAHEILQDICKKYKLKPNQEVKVYAARCSGLFSSTPDMERLNHAIFCYVGQAFYVRGTFSPYHGKRITSIEFPGMDYLEKIVKCTVLETEKAKKGDLKA